LAGRFRPTMINGILGKKVGMTQVFAPTGEVVPVTVVEAGPCVVTQVKTKDVDGYEAVQLGFEETKRLNKPEKGHIEKQGRESQAKLPMMRNLREVHVEKAAEHKVGEKVDASVFKAGDIVDVVGVSKGKGFAGVVKRYHFAGGPKTHGQSDRHRAPGAIGSGTTPGRVYLGKRMAGRMGNDRVTVQNVRIVEADPERNLILIRGTVPGGVNGLLLIKKAVKKG
jgi:large subunit ribosomal protein L3